MLHRNLSTLQRCKFSDASELICLVHCVTPDLTRPMGVLHAGLQPPMRIEFTMAGDSNMDSERLRFASQEACSRVSAENYRSCHCFAEDC